MKLHFGGSCVFFLGVFISVLGDKKICGWWVMNGGWRVKKSGALRHRV